MAGRGSASSSWRAARSRNAMSLLYVALLFMGSFLSVGSFSRAAHNPHNPANLAPNLPIGVFLRDYNELAALRESLPQSPSISSSSSPAAQQEEENRRLASTQTVASMENERLNREAISRRHLSERSTSVAGSSSTMCTDTSFLSPWSITYACSLNMECLASDLKDSPQCQDLHVPCRDCKGPNQCGSLPFCKDKLFQCPTMSFLDILSLPEAHPCNNPHCAVNPKSYLCRDALFQWCCAPGTPGCDRTEKNAECSMEGCSYFLQKGSPNRVSKESLTCPFRDANATCHLPVCSFHLTEILSSAGPDAMPPNGDFRSSFLSLMQRTTCGSEATTGTGEQQEGPGEYEEGRTAALEALRNYLALELVLRNESTSAGGSPTLGMLRSALASSFPMEVYQAVLEKKSPAPVYLPYPFNVVCGVVLSGMVPTVSPFDDLCNFPQRPQEVSGEVLQCLQQSCPQQLTNCTGDSAGCYRSFSLYVSGFYDNQTSLAGNAFQGLQQCGLSQCTEPLQFKTSLPSIDESLGSCLSSQCSAQIDSCVADPKCQNVTNGYLSSLTASDNVVFGDPLVDLSALNASGILSCIEGCKGPMQVPSDPLGHLCWRGHLLQRWFLSQEHYSYDTIDNRALFYPWNIICSTPPLAPPKDWIEAVNSTPTAKEQDMVVPKLARFGVSSFLNLMDMLIAGARYVESQQQTITSTPQQQSSKPRRLQTDVKPTEYSYYELSTNSTSSTNYSAGSNGTYYGGGSNGGYSENTGSYGCSSQSAEDVEHLRTVMNFFSDMVRYDLANGSSTYMEGGAPALGSFPIILAQAGMGYELNSSTPMNVSEGVLQARLPYPFNIVCGVFFSGLLPFFDPFDRICLPQSNLNMTLPPEVQECLEKKCQSQLESCRASPTCSPTMMAVLSGHNPADGANHETFQSFYGCGVSHCAPNASFLEGYPTVESFIGSCVSRSCSSSLQACGEQANCNHTYEAITSLLPWEVMGDAMGDLFDMEDLKESGLLQCIEERQCASGLEDYVKIVDPEPKALFCRFAKTLQGVLFQSTNISVPLADKALLYPWNMICETALLPPPPELLIRSAEGEPKGGLLAFNKFSALSLANIWSWLITSIEKEQKQSHCGGYDYPTGGNSTSGGNQGGSQGGYNYNIPSTGLLSITGYYCPMSACKSQLEACARNDACRAQMQSFSGPDSPSDHQSFQSLVNCLSRKCDFSLNKQACARAIGKYCNENDDPGCQRPCPHDCTRGESCPCTSSACNALVSTRLCTLEQGACMQFKRELVGILLETGHYNPQYGNNENLGLPKPAPLPFNLLHHQNLMTLIPKCSVWEEILRCVNTTVTYCNQNPHAQSCKSALSVCGDGFVTWGESCDSGKFNVDMQQGWDPQKVGHCVKDWCTYDSSRVVCPIPGKPCHKCILPPPYQTNTCPFCANNLLQGLPVSVSQSSSNSSRLTGSPCFYAPCTRVTDRASAEQCDSYVAEYCAAIRAQDMGDPGCDNYVPQGPKFSYTKVPNNCEYKIHTFDVNAKHLTAIRYAVFECPLVSNGDENGEPPGILFQYSNPLFNMPTSEMNKLDPLVLSLLQDLAMGRTEVSLTNLTSMQIWDVLPYVFPTIKNQYNGSLQLPTYAELFLINGTLTDESRQGFRVAPWSQPNNVQCQQDWGLQIVSQRPLQMLPPTQEPAKWALLAELLRFRFSGTNQPNNQGLQDFSNLDLIKLVPSSMRRKKGVIQFMLGLSETMAYGTSSYENEQLICSNEYYSAGIAQSINYNNTRARELGYCHITEDYLASGAAGVRLMPMFYEESCKDKSCSSRVEPCKLFKLDEQPLTLNASRFSEVIQVLIEGAQRLDTDVTSFEGLLNNYLAAAIETKAPAYDDGLRLLNSMFITGKQVTYLKNVPSYCSQPWSIYNETLGVHVPNPDYQTDPCCNYELQSYMCCRPKDIPDGLIDVVVGIKDDAISRCKHPSRVASMMASIMEDMKSAQECTESLTKNMNTDPWTEVNKVSTKCNAELSSVGGKTCKKDSDCGSCSLIKCQIETGKSTGTCSQPWNVWGTCIVECYQESMDPVLVGYLKEGWNVTDATNDTEFALAFQDRMTESTCSGPESWHSDIGYTRMEYRCDPDCQKDNVCSSWQYISYRQSTDSAFRVDNALTCAAEGGVWTCMWKNTNGVCQYSTCQFPDQKLPCDENQRCYQKCGSLYTREGCESVMNGTWIPGISGQTGDICCPKDAYVVKITENGVEKDVCSYIPPGGPPSYSIDNPTCCEAANGTWVQQNPNYGYCCTGRMTSSGDYTYCQDRLYWNDVQWCYNECMELYSDCIDCERKYSTCCGEKVIYANKTACLSYQTCNDATVQPGQECNNPNRNMCGQCQYGPCWPMWNQRDQACLLNMWSETACLEAGGHWEQRQGDWSQQCYRHTKAEQDSPSYNGWSCFTSTQEGPAPEDYCPNPNKPKVYYLEGLNEKPAKYWDSVSCNRGCYFPAVNESVCQANWFYWYSEGGNGTGVCSNWWMTKESCEAKTMVDGSGNTVTGTYNSLDVTYIPSRLNNEAECEQGICNAGMYSNQGWTKDQCQQLNVAQCDRWTEMCYTWSSETQRGGCFNSTNNHEYLRSIVNPAECSSETGDLRWLSCTNYTSSREDCNNPSHPVTSALRCYYGWFQPPTKEICESVGQCNGWYELREDLCSCTDPSWKHEAHRCTARYLKIVNDTNTNYAYSYFDTEWCDWSQRVYKDGICVSAWKAECPEANKKVSGCYLPEVTTKGQCQELSTPQNRTRWVSEPKTEADCYQYLGCREQFRSSFKSEEECDACSGSIEPKYQWESGRWRGPTVTPLTWLQKSELTTVNSWQPMIAEWRLKAELATPLIKRAASTWKTILLSKYNMISTRLDDIICDCGFSGGDSLGESCFGNADSNVIGVTSSFCGEEKALQGTCFYAKLNTTCQSANSEALIEQGEKKRRMLTESAGESGSNSISMAVTLTFVSSGDFETVVEPCTNGTALNPTNMIHSLPIRNSNGVAWAQLLGDGNGVSVNDNGTFNSMALCLSRKLRVFDYGYPVLDFARYEVSTNAWTIVNTTVSMSAEGLCATVSSPGVYFPIARVDDATFNARETLSCPGACENGICFYNTTTKASECKCKCGFSGSTCSSGCPNHCNFAGTCGIENACSCRSSRSGADCSQILCPTANGMPCNGQGVCTENGSNEAVCLCGPNYVGEDCSRLYLAPRDDSDLFRSWADASSYTEEPTPAPTSAPTPKPTPTPTREPTAQPTAQPTSSPTPRPTRAPTPPAPTRPIEEIFPTFAPTPAKAETTKEELIPVYVIEATTSMKGVTVEQFKAKEQEFTETLAKSMSIDPAAVTIVYVGTVPPPEKTAKRKLQDSGEPKLYVVFETKTTSKEVAQTVAAVMSDPVRARNTVSDALLETSIVQDPDQVGEVSGVTFAVEYTPVLGSGGGEEETQDSKVALYGAIGGAVAGLLLLIGVSYYCCCRKRGAATSGERTVPEKETN